MRNEMICTVLFFCFFVGGHGRALGLQQDTSTPSPDAIMAAQAQANQAAAYRRTEEFEHQQLYEQQQQRLRQSGIQSQQPAPGEIQPRDGRPHPRQKEPDWDPERQNYDPMAGPAARKQSWSGALDAATGHINPCNNDWGGLLAQWHIALAQETIANIYFYVFVLETAGLGILAMVIVSMRAERERRLQIGGGVIAQLYNQYAHARNKAYEAIRAYNHLVEETEDRLDALVRDGAPDNEGLSDTPGLSVSTLTAGKSANIVSGDIPQGPVRYPVNDVDTDSPLPTPKESFQVKPFVSLAAIDKSAASSRPTFEDTPPAADIEDELESKRRQIETLQARLQNKTLRINELEDALAVSANKNKIPEL